MIYRIRPGIKALILHQGKVLVVSENLTRESGNEILHDFPGGGMEPGETMEETVKREVFEEVGLTIEVDRPVGCWEWIINFSKGDQEHQTTILCFGLQCHLVGEPVIDLSGNPAQEDIFEARWLTPQEIIESNLLDNQMMVESLRNVR